MAPSMISKAIGAVKDQTAILNAKISSNLERWLEINLVKATSHDDNPTPEKGFREILRMTSYSYDNVTTCVSLIANRLRKTHDWIVSLKCLMLVHRLLNEGGHVLRVQILFSTQILKLSVAAEAHSSCWDHSIFIRAYANYLQEKLMFMDFEMNRCSDYHSDYGLKPSSVVVAKPSDVHYTFTLKKLKYLQGLLDKLLLCRPSGFAKNEDMILVALYTILKESFHLHTEIRATLALILEKFVDMEYERRAYAMELHIIAAKQIEELIRFHDWCKDLGVGRSWEYPRLEKIDRNVTTRLQLLLKDKEVLEQTR